MKNTTKTLTSKRNIKRHQNGLIEHPFEETKTERYIVLYLDLDIRAATNKIFLFSLCGGSVYRHLTILFQPATITFCTFKLSDQKKNNFVHPEERA